MPCDLPWDLSASSEHEPCPIMLQLISVFELQEEMSQMDDTYSRGIDPNMADPSKCHSHPDVPPQWPPQPKVQAYVQQVCILLTVFIALSLI